MEKVQFQIESTLPELKDLSTKGLFTRTELGTITARRKKFETSLIKRVPVKQDFLDYAQYEIGLEKLRRARYKRLGLDKSAQPRSVSSYSIVRRVLYILRRATDKFPYDLGVWMAYIDYARSEGMTKVVLQGLTTALQLHPRNAALYILLSQHYLDPTSPTSSTSPRRAHPNFAIENVSPARKTLLLGLRLMPSDRDLWREYIKLEIGWVEALRRRWKVLGIDLAGGEGAEKMDEDVAAGLEGEDLGANAFGSDGEQARKSIIKGDLIITVLQSAFSNPVLEKSLTFHTDLLHLLRTYPTGLRPRLLDAVYTHLEEEPSFTFNPVARKTLLERTLYDTPYDPEKDTKHRSPETADDPVVLHGQELVQQLGEIVKQFRNPVPGAPEGWESTWNEQVGLWLLHWAQRMSSNEDLQAYLLASINPLIKPSAKPTERLLRAHIEFLESLDEMSAVKPGPEKVQALRAGLGRLYPEGSR
ncbi:hypothetical protein QFC20_004881 [Naganishia adeliensis]|uniref:Uncharacterized protein n=1 Tax=Naganishia adeliensis TaxID=92952 RepID=A0ACC2VVM8_9TREE|nr:hypothetical protein QFC20_004881 [Naganishia adeliensis]